MGRAYAITRRFALSEGKVVRCGAAPGIERLWACYHAVIGIPTRLLQDDALTVRFATLIDVLTTGKIDDGIFVCRADAIQADAHAALARWPGSIDLRTCGTAARPTRRTQARLSR